MIYRKMEVSDAQEVAQLEQKMFSDAWGEKQYAEAIEQSHSICIVGESDDGKQLLGYAVCYQALDEGELLKIAVEESVQGQGIGQDLLDTVTIYGQYDGMKKMFLEVRESNEKARRFYRNNEFKEDGMRPRFYRNPEESAVLMSKNVEMNFLMKD